MVERADTIGLEVSRDHIVAVVDAHSAYLQVAGAIHLDDPVAIEADLADLPMLEQSSDPADGGD